MKSPNTAKVIGIEGYRFSEQTSERLEIANLAIKLQQTLEIAPLLQSFCAETAAIIPCDSVRFANKSRDLFFQTGEEQLHRCRYRLALEEDDLGEIECTRQQPFTIKETQAIENLLSLLIYPLRNALLYQKAVAEAHRDPLTQIANRAAFNEALNREICAFNRHHTEFSIMVIDIDYFKQINDTYGHLVGDQVLKEVATTIRNTIRRSDEVFRYGGEEFVVILSNTNIAGARFIGERVRRELKQLAFKNYEQLQVTASIGIAASNTLVDADKTLHHADKALYEAKNTGRDKVAVYA
ncbi:GGDEF domain-containing protein [Aliikangiella maris]|uniref:GGDEF domain-containing protein n=2 Tax=Aliikangiella maris TaxID=3162458 RepID=A0ABV3MK70_9GAMM